MATPKKVKMMIGWRIAMETPVRPRPAPQGVEEEARLLCRSCNVKPRPKYNCVAEAGSPQKTFIHQPFNT